MTELALLLQHVTNRINTYTLENDQAYDAARKAVLLLIEAQKQLENAAYWNNKS